MMHIVLSKYEFLFNRIIGNQKTKPVDIELKPDTNMYHVNPHPLPR